MSQTGNTSWRSPSNIALVKYWGKKGIQLPINPSLSMTLQESYTETSIRYKPGSKERLEYEFWFEGKRNEKFSAKLNPFFEKIKDLLPGLAGLELEIHSHNSFPHSTGIASSASAFSALALGLCEIDHNVRKIPANTDQFLRLASEVSRLGSGSACRSLYGGYASWGELETLEGSSDHFASPLMDIVHPDFSEFYDAILIVSSKEKSMRSTQGHALMENNPFSVTRSLLAKNNAIKLLDVMKQGDLLSMRKIVESEAASLHAMFMTSDPAFKLIRPETDKIISSLLEFRSKSGTEFCYTLDAGPNIHLLYPHSSREKILPFITNEILPLCEDGKWIDDHIGAGPKKSDYNP